ncbi:MAG: zinc ribbon domain-containing protein [Pirellulales bacterium]
MSEANTLDDQPIVEAEIVDEPLVDAESLPPSGLPCDACGCPVELEDNFCPACGATSEQAEEAKEKEQIEEQIKEDYKFIQCNGCGAKVATQPEERSYVCPFCDSTYVVEYDPEFSGRQRPEFIVGFKLTQDRALELFRAWIKSNHLFRPGDLHQAKIEEKMKGVYLPFWSFSMLAKSNWRASIGEYWYRTETYTTRQNGKTVTRTRRVRETAWWPLAGDHHHYYSGYMISASKGLTQQEADRIKPYNLPAMKRFEPYYLAGWTAEEYSIEKDHAIQVCHQEFYRREQANIGHHLPGDTHSSLEVKTHFSQENSDLCLLPMYLLSYRYQDKIYRFMVNGQTGKFDGDKPLSWKRIWAAIGTGIGIILLILLIIAIMNAMNG